MSQQKNRQHSWALESRRPAYQGQYQIDRLSFSYSLYDGSTTGSIEQELFLRGNVVGLIPYDPASDRLALVEQFRIGAMHQSPDPWMTEIIAGKIDADETPEQGVKREAYEEAGIKLDDVELFSHYLASPGSSTEEVFLYYAETNLSKVSGTYGLAHENEDIRVSVVSAQQAFDMLESRKIRNALSIIALQWLKLNRAGL